MEEEEEINGKSDEIRILWINVNIRNLEDAGDFFIDFKMITEGIEEGTWVSIVIIILLVPTVYFLYKRQKNKKIQLPELPMKTTL